MELLTWTSSKPVSDPTLVRDNTCEGRGLGVVRGGGGEGLFNSLPYSCLLSCQMSFIRLAYIN